MVKVQCIKCSREGSLTKKQTKSKGITYVYWYVEHHIGNKIKWCYLGKYEKLPDAYKKLIHKDTQNVNETNKPNLSFFNHENLPEKSLCSYINSILTKTSSGTRILMILRITRSSASIMMRRLWIRSSHLSQVAVPSPQGVLRTGTRSLLVGRGWGPLIFTPVFSAMAFSSPHTSSSFL